MKTVSILLLDQVNIAGMENIRQGFLEANKYLQMHGKPPKFKVELVGNGHPVQIDDGLYAIRPQKSIEQIQETDLIIIPPLRMDNLLEAIKQNQKYLPWLVEQYRQLCIGKRTLERRFKIATGNTMSEYLQRVRIEVAKRKFEEGHYAIKEVMYQVGYADAKFFSSLFKRHVGLNPAEYKVRYA